jgi:hypothetical protein
MALDTVQDYLDRARVLLLDTVEPYRYETVDLVEALNLGILEARRLRPDLLRSFFREDLPEFAIGDLTEEVDIDQQYRVSFVYYICGHAQLQDEEDVTDARASTFLNKFVAQLTGIA